MVNASRGRVANFVRWGNTTRSIRNRWTRTNPETRGWWEFIYWNIFIVDRVEWIFKFLCSSNGNQYRWSRCKVEATSRRSANGMKRDLNKLFRWERRCRARYRLYSRASKSPIGRNPRGCSLGILLKSLRLHGAIRCGDSNAGTHGNAPGLRPSCLGVWVVLWVFIRVCVAFDAHTRE